MSDDRRSVRFRALLAASVTGTAVVMIQTLLVAGLILIVADWDRIGLGSVGEAIGFLLQTAVNVGKPSMLIIFVVLLVVGCPVWWALHLIGVRSRVAATVSGAVVALALGFVVAAALLLVTPWAAGFAPWVLAFLSLPGAMAGWTLHRVAYGKANKP